LYDGDVTSIGIIGASGYTGAELLRLCARHPQLDVAFATGDSQAGNLVTDLYPALAAVYGDRRFDAYGAVLSDGRLDDVELVFLGLPHGASQALVPQLLKRVPFVIDLAADFRLKDPSLYPTWYHAEHAVPELLEQFAYGLPELFRPALLGAKAIAVPGCHVTAAALVLAPFVRAGLIEPTGIVVNTATGVSGAGRGPKANTQFCAVDEDIVAYGLLDHRHTPEIEQNLSFAADGTPLGTAAQVIFTPHLAPMNRGILATCHARPTGTLTTTDALAVLREAYADEPFVVVDERPPSTKATLGSNCVHVSARVDPRTGWFLGLSALDNLTKGASGGAIQCANLALGIDETTGLDRVGLYP
jgi:N-acetyl-gamma-glutamyl-phosphate reductase